MNDTTSAAPSDAEIAKLAADHIKAFAQFTGAGDVWVEGEVAFARAVLAKWGTPQQEAQEPAHPSCKSDMTVNGGALKLALNVLRRAGKTEVADELEKTAQPALEALPHRTMVRCHHSTEKRLLKAYGSAAYAAEGVRIVAI